MQDLINYPWISLYKLPSVRVSNIFKKCDSLGSNIGSNSKKKDYRPRFTPAHLYSRAYYKH